MTESNSKTVAGIDAGTSTFEASVISKTGLSYAGWNSRRTSFSE